MSMPLILPYVCCIFTVFNLLQSTYNLNPKSTNGRPIKCCLLAEQKVIKMQPFSDRPTVPTVSTNQFPLAFSTLCQIIFPEFYVNLIHAKTSSSKIKSVGLSLSCYKCIQTVGPIKIIGY